MTTAESRSDSSPPAAADDAKAPAQASTAAGDDAKAPAEAPTAATTTAPVPASSSSTEAEQRESVPPPETHGQPFGEQHEAMLEPRGEWHFAGWGHATRITNLEDGPVSVGLSHHMAPQNKLGQWRATAICGNDITSSVLYVAALCTLSAGVYAPIALAMVGLVLYIFRRIYAEVGSALPLNGGAYNVLLNTTSKGKASLAACLTLLSYIATAVISANEALHYAHHVVHAVPVMIGTVVLLAIFAGLNVIGISESAVVALVIFIIHISTLLLLTVAAGIYVYQDGFATLLANWKSPPPGGIQKALFFGFAAGMLGISGFESSANFIEEQKPGVFPKTLRNMWIAVFFFNPTISLLALGMLPVATFGEYQTALLSEMGNRSVGPWLASWVSIDAVLVLSGAVLTSYVGVTGLVRRMSLDRCLPQILLRENRRFRTPHWIILSFFTLCCSILFITKGDVGTLAGVYTISFLGVMLLFAVGNRLLAIKRGRLPRSTRASWPMVVVATAAVGAGLVGNVLKSTEQAVIFLMYLAVAITAVGIMFLRVRILYALLYVGRAIHEKVRELNEGVANWTTGKITQINSQAIVFFTRGDGPANLRRAIEYVLDNEHTNTLIVVHVYQDETKIPAQLSQQLMTLDEIFPEIRIDFIAVRGRFGPDLIDKLSGRLNVPKNYMFIGCPGDGFPHNLGDLGGVRLIV
ncbi:MAG: APC family permease [Polyangiaceae bacterium]